MKRLLLLSICLASSLAACGGKDRIAIDNRTTRDVVLADGDFGERYLIVACGQIVIEEPNGAKPLESSAPLPSGAVLVRQHLPSMPDGTVDSTLTITQEGVWFDHFDSPPPCEGVPLTTPEPTATPEPSLSAE